MPLRHILQRSGSHNFLYFLLISVCCFIVSCSDFSKGNKAFKNNDLKSAQAFYETALRKNADSKKIKEALVQTLILRAKKQYAKNKRRAEEFIKKGESQYTADMSQETRDHFYEYHLKAAATLLNDGKNFKAIEELEYALKSYGPNKKIESELEGLSKRYALHMFTLGKAKFEEWKQLKIISKLLYAEQYIAQAIKYNPQHADAQKIIKKLRVKTLGIANPDDIIPFAVTNMTRRNDHAVLDVFIASNNSLSPVNIDPVNFTLIDDRGSSYKVDLSYKNKYRMFRSKSLKYPEKARGKLVYPILKDNKLQKIVFADANGNKAEKYFP